MQTKIVHRQSARLSLIAVLTGLAAVSLVSVVLLGLLSYRTQRAVSERMDRIAAIAQMQSLLKDAETGERGYLITQDPSYLDPYNAALARLPQQIRTTRELFGAETERSKIVETVIARTQRKLFTLAAAIRIAHSRGFEAARIATREGSGKRIMNEARDLTAEVIVMERRDQDRELRALGGWQTAFYLATAVLVLLVSFLLVSALLDSLRALREAESESEGKSLLLGEVLEASPDLIFVKDLAGRYTHANRATLEVMGRSSVLGLKDSDIFPEDVWRKIVSDDRQTIMEVHPHTFEENLVPHGTAGRRYFLTTKVALRDAAGAPKGLVGVSKDISERKDAEEKQKLLINELNHRVKNTLAVLHSIALQTFKGTDKSRIAAFEGRLQSLSAAHNILTRHRWSGARLSEVVEAAIASFGGNDQDLFSRTGPEVSLKPNEALAISMILHELATNAIKYGALSVAGGHVNITWRLDRTALNLVWTERGGPLVTQPKTFGFGTRLIERSLGGDADGAVKIDYAQEGLVCELRLSRALMAGEAA